MQLLTPDEKRGRVSAVNGLFIGTSNELGGFESGLVAHWFGPVVSVVSGGIGTIWWCWQWPLSGRNYGGMGGWTRSASRQVNSAISLRYSVACAT